MAAELVELKGHIIDSLLLPKILDDILDHGGHFEIRQIHVGKRTTDISYAQLSVSAPSAERLRDLLKRIEQHGAVLVAQRDAHLKRAPKAGVFPDGFYSTTNLPTRVRMHGRWLHVADLEMDCSIVVARGHARCVPMHRIAKGDAVVCGAGGVRVTPLERSRSPEVFQFMGSAISSERPKTRIIQALADEIRALKRQRRKILVVAGPAVVHTGAAGYLEQLIRRGFVEVLFAGNGLATHDIEYALYGTSLGIRLDHGVPAREGHEHHLRAINTIRRLGSIRAAVRARVLRHGIMHACVTRGVTFVLAGSIRDDGPLPDVVTDTMAAQDRMRAAVKGVGMALMVASTLHAIATGNILPATVKTVCVDINPAVVTKLADRGSFQSLGLVMDSESFLRELLHQLTRRS